MSAWGAQSLPDPEVAVGTAAGIKSMERAAGTLSKQLGKSKGLSAKVDANTTKTVAACQGRSNCLRSAAGVGNFVVIVRPKSKPDETLEPGKKLAQVVQVALVDGSDGKESDIGTFTLSDRGFSGRDVRSAAKKISEMVLSLTRSRDRDEGNAAHKSGDVATAVLRLQRAVRLGATDKETLLNYGQALVQSDRHRLAESILGRALKAGADPALTQDLLGQVALKDKNNAKTVAHWEKAIKAGANRPEMFRVVGRHYAKRKNAAKAKPALEQAVSLNPKDGESAFLLGEILFKESKSAKRAAALYLVAASNGYEVGKAWERAGLLVEDPKVSIEHLEKARKASRDSASLRGKLGQSLIAMGRYPEAEVHLKASLNFNAAQPEIMLALGQVQLQLKQGPQALKTLRAALKAGAPFRQTYVALAQAADLSGDGKAASKYHVKAHKAGDSSLPTLKGAGLAWAESDPQKARTLLRAAVDKASGDAELAVILAEIELKLGDSKAAKPHFERALHDPKVAARAHAGLGWVALSAKDSAVARNSFEAAVKAGLKDGALFKALGDLQKAAGQESQAMTSYDAALKAGIKDRALLVALAEMHRKAGALDRARELAQTSTKDRKVGGQAHRIFGLGGFGPREYGGGRAQSSAGLSVGHSFSRSGGTLGDGSRGATQRQGPERSTSRPGASPGG